MSPEEKARTLVDAFHKRGNTGLTQLEHDIARALREARADALEEAASSVTTFQRNWTHPWREQMQEHIRSLKDKGGA